MLTSINARNRVWCREEDFPELRRLPISYFDKENRCPERMLVFQLEFELTDTKNIIGLFSAGCRFRLFINGRFVDDGPVEIGGDYNNVTAPDWWFYDERELSAFLQNGKNIITFELFPAGFTQMDYTDGHGWIFLELKQGDRTITFPLDTWRCRQNAAFVDNCHYNALMENDFDPWKECVSVADGELSRLDLPALTNEFEPFAEVLFPCPYHDGEVTIVNGNIIIKPGRPVFFYLRFSREIAAHFYMKVEGPERAIIELEFQEQMGIRPATSSVETYITGEGVKHYRTVKAHAFKWVRVTVHPSCLQSVEPLESMKLSRLGAFKRGFPLPSRKALPIAAAAFKTVDEQCLDNLALCMWRMHLDSPIHQEGLGCTGDYRIEALMSYAGYGESRLALR